MVDVEEMARTSLEGLHGWWGELKQCENRSNDLDERRELQAGQATLLAEIERRVVALPYRNAASRPTAIVEIEPIESTSHVQGLG